jgi:hypothetical protein
MMSDIEKSQLKYTKENGHSASINGDGPHTISFFDDVGVKFYTEKYVECPFALVVNAAKSWANGNRAII